MKNEILFLNGNVLNEIIKRKSSFQGIYGEQFTDKDRVFNIDNNLIVVDREDTDSNINDYITSIITINSYLFNPEDPHESYSKNCLRRKQEILTSLMEGKTIILLVEKTDDLLTYVMKSLNIKIKVTKNYTDDIITDLLKFKNFNERYCNPTAGYVSDKINPICSFDDTICGFHINHGKGTLYVLPVIIKDNSKDFFLPLFTELLKNISSIDSEFKLPEYLITEKLLDEKKMMESKEKYSSEINKIDLELNKLNIIKSILVLKHDLLVDNIITTFNEMEVNTHRLEQYEEDLWITEGGKKEVIIEVKGTNKNITRKQINDLDNHRDENKLYGDFPSLLIVNSFSDANNFTEKNIFPEKDSLKRAKAQNIMLMRTLDIYNLFKLIKNKKITNSQFLSLIKSKDCGWIKVDEKEMKLELYS